MQEPYKNAHNTTAAETFFITDEDVLVCLKYANKIALPVFESQALIWVYVQRSVFIVDEFLDKVK